MYLWCEQMLGAKNPSLDELDRIILKIIWETKNPVTAQEISEKMGLAVSFANRRLTGLRKAGFVATSRGGYVITEGGKETMGFPKIDEKTARKILQKISREFFPLLHRD